MSRRTFELTEQGQVTDRYTKAIEQLGSDKLAVRIGGIYALERIARDSARDHPAGMEVLTAFIREHSHKEWPPPGPDGEARVGSFSAQRTPVCAAGGSCRGSQAGAARFPGVLLSRGPLLACCYRSGSAAAARSRATDPAMTRAHPAAILGLRRCTARATQGTWITAFGASTAIASTVSRRGQRRPHHTPRTIPATVEASLYWGVSVALKKGADRARWRSRRRAAGVGVRAAAGAVVPGLRNTPSLCSRWMFCCMFCRASAGVGASVPRPQATSP